VLKIPVPGRSGAKSSEICSELMGQGWGRPERARLAPELGEPKVEPGEKGR